MNIVVAIVSAVPPVAVVHVVPLVSEAQVAQTHYERSAWRGPWILPCSILHIL